MSETEVSDKVSDAGGEKEEESPVKRATRGTARRGRSKRITEPVNIVRSDKDTENEEQSSEEQTDKKVEEEEKSAVNGEVTTKPDEKTEDKKKEDDKTQDNATNDKTDEANDVPELDAAPPPTITTTNTTKSLKLRTSISISDENEEKKGDEDGKEDDNQIPEEFTVVEEVESDSDDVQEVPVEKMEVDGGDASKTSPQEDHQTLEGMTVIDEVVDDSEKKESEVTKDNNMEPDTEMVSEDELPAETKEPLDTEAVSDEELPTTGDLPDTEAVSEDELPPEGSSEKKKKKIKKSPPSKSKPEGDGKKESGDGSAGKKESAKRKLVDGEYDPSSPTSSDESPAAKKAASEKAASKPPAKPKVLPELEKYWKAVKEDPADFTGWTYLLQYVDQENDVDAAREAYDAFLSHYPYCYGYWRKYADYEKRKGNKAKCEEVFDRGLKAIPFSVDLWIHYLNYCKTTLTDNEELLRNTFEKSLEACGLEFRSDRLWEAYLKWETENKNIQNITNIYDRLLGTPTQGHAGHYDAFCNHVNNNPPNKVLSVDEFLTLRQEVLQVLRQSESSAGESVVAPGDCDTEAPPGEEPAEEVTVASPEETAKLREKIIAIRKKIYTGTREAVISRQAFEEGIKRPYFHVKPLERCQLKNWREYLEFEKAQGDQKRCIVLFERCLIACALYEEFWLRYLHYLQEKVADVAFRWSSDEAMIRDVFERACTIHHKKKPALHLNWAMFEEMQGNYEKAGEVLQNLEKVAPNLIQITYRRINMARRSGDVEKASELYEHYIEKAKNRVISNNMSIKYARFSWKTLNDVDKAVNILKKALEKDKENPRLYLQLIDMALQRRPVDEAEVVEVIDQYMAREHTEVEQKVMFAQRKIEFLEDFGTNVKSVQKATDEFQKLLKQLQEKKKKDDSSKVKQDEPATKKSKPDTKDSSGPSHMGPSQVSQPPPSTNYSAPNYNQSNYQPPQNNYQGGYNQQPPYNQPPYNQQYNQSDPNYNNYQNWGYSQSGYGNYNQGWGGYNYY